MARVVPESKHVKWFDDGSYTIQALPYSTPIAPDSPLTNHISLFPGPAAIVFSVFLHFLFVTRPQQLHDDQGKALQDFVDLRLEDWKARTRQV
mmetsp:Transcript_61225/g.149884  ORF Transcript_61225/g.149884 Transcript_61225/m.149884 type:complete len:93 (-) Transcript_61225:545-823(-)